MAPNVPRSRAIFSLFTACSNLALAHAFEVIPSLTPTSALGIIPTLLPSDLPSLPDVASIETILPVDIPSLDVLDGVESVLPVEVPSLDDLGSVESILPVDVPSLDGLDAVESSLPVELPSVDDLTNLGNVGGIKIPKRQATTTTAAPASTTIPAGWAYKYCATDRNIGTRALQTKLPNTGFSFDNYSNEECLQRCGDLGFTIAGTEYGGECHCGNQVNEDSHQAPESECNKACYANNAEICGGDLRLSLYAKAGARLPPSSVVGQCLYPECFTTTTTAASSTTGASATSTVPGLSTRSPLTSLTSSQTSTTSQTSTASGTTTISVTSTLTSTTTRSASSTNTSSSAITTGSTSSGLVTTTAATATTTTTTITTTATATTTTGSKVGETPVTNYQPTVTPLVDDSQYAANDAKVMVNDRNGVYQYQIFNNGAVDGTDLPIPDEYADRQINTMLECTDLCNYINQQNGGTVVCEAVVYDGPGLCYPLTDTYKSDIDGRFSYYYPGSIAAMALRSPSYPAPTEGPTDPNAVSVSPITTTAATTTPPVSNPGGAGTSSSASSTGDGTTTNTISPDASSATSGTSTRTSRVTLSVITVYPTDGVGQRTVNVYISYCPSPTPTLLSNENAKRWIKVGRAKIEKR